MQKHKKIDWIITVEFSNGLSITSPTATADVVRYLEKQNITLDAQKNVIHAYIYPYAKDTLKQGSANITYLEIKKNAKTS
jgi:hypothetical protein